MDSVWHHSTRVVPDPTSMDGMSASFPGTYLSVDRVSAPYPSTDPRGQITGVAMPKYIPHAI